MVQLNELLGKRSLITLLELMAENSGTEFTFTELWKKTKLSKATLAKYLQFLTKNEFIEIKKAGSIKLYKYAKENIINKHFKILRSLFALQPLKQIAQKHNTDIYLYGSTARGENTEKSDIDLLVIGEDITKEIKTALGKEVKTTTYTPLEWSEMSKKDKPFYERVEKDKIKL